MKERRGGNSQRVGRSPDSVHTHTTWHIGKNATGKEERGTEMNRRQRLEKQRIYQKEYYQIHRQEILERYKQQYQRKTPPPKMTEKGKEVEFFQEWNKSLQDRLKSTDLEDWLRSAIQRTIDENNRQIEKINDKQENREMHKTD